MNLREWALPLYTILIQLSAGSLVILCLLRLIMRKKYRLIEVDEVFSPYIFVIVITIFAGILGAHFHLSRPSMSFQTIRNFQYSWLSREVFFTASFAFTTFSLWLFCQFNLATENRKRIFGWFASSFGLITVYCMARVYLLPTQVVWNAFTTVVSFFASMFVLGTVAVATFMTMDIRFSELVENRPVEIREQLFKSSAKQFAVVLAAGGIISISLVGYQILTMTQLGSTAEVSYELLMGLYQSLLILRIAVMVLGIGIFIKIVRDIIVRERRIQDQMNLVYIACLLLVIGEITNRFLFYATHVRVGI